MAAVVRSKAKEILSFWFARGTAEEGKSRGAWFQKNEAFDEEIRSKFLNVVEAVEASVLGDQPTGDEQPLSPDTDSADTMLAYVITCDQFPRNLFRNSARAFGLDFVAREVAATMIEKKLDQQLLPVERVFVYIPLEHSENLEDQHEFIRLTQALGEVDPSLKGFATYGEHHRVIIARFGRFPHRNVALGRESTAEEIEFLKGPNSSF